MQVSGRQGFFQKQDAHLVGCTLGSETRYCQPAYRFVKVSCMKYSFSLHHQVFKSVEYTQNRNSFVWLWRELIISVVSLRVSVLLRTEGQKRFFPLLFIFDAGSVNWKASWERALKLSSLSLTLSEAILRITSATFTTPTLLCFSWFFVMR